MNSISKVLAAAAAAMVMSSAAVAADRSDIEAAVQRWQDAFNAGDGTAAANDVFSESARLLPPDSGPIEGREAIAGFWQAVMDSPANGLELALIDVDIVSDTTAIETGTWSIAVPADGGAETRIGGKTLVIWKLEDDGVWRMTQDMWNDGN